MFGNPYIHLKSFSQKWGNGGRTIELVISHNYNAELVVKITNNYRTRNPIRKQGLKIDSVKLLVDRDNTRQVHDPYLHNVWGDCKAYLQKLLVSQGYYKPSVVKLLNQYYIKG